MVCMGPNQLLHGGIGLRKSLRQKNFSRLDRQQFLRTTDHEGIFNFNATWSATLEMLD